MRSFELTFALALTTTVSALPTLQSRWYSQQFWAPRPLTMSYIDFGKRVPGPDSGAPTCDLSQAHIATAPIPLPAPAAGLTLSHVALGRGTQNYTCDLTNTTAVPVAVGAVASLFNVTCIAADSPELLSKLPPIALDIPVPSSSDPTDAANVDLSGHHYFLDPTTPFFNMDTNTHRYGTGAFKKANASPAPSDAPVGQWGQGHGAVPWLKLDAKNSEGQAFQEVYRVNTAGGSPPKTCQGQPAKFEVQYSAEYWLYE